MSTDLSTRVWHDTKTAASATGMHVQTIRRACESGELTASQRVQGGKWRIHHTDLDQWLRGGKPSS